MPDPTRPATEPAATDPGLAPDTAAGTPAEPPTPVTTAATTAVPPAVPLGRGFPGFPAGDPRQLPLSQRPRGLDAPPVPGGGDPELRATLARERPYVRLLVAMVAVIVGGSLLLTFLAIISAAVLR
jgi:hypothetical protein